MYASVKFVILKDALQFYGKEDEITSPSSSTSSSITELVLPSTSALFQSKTDNAIILHNPSGTDSKPLLQSRSGTRLTEKLPLSRVTSLPLLHPTSSSPIPIDVKQARSFNTNMVKFTSLSSALMNKRKLQGLSGNEKLSLASREKPFPSDNCIVHDDKEQMNIQLSSDVEAGEMPIVLESIGSQDDLITSQAIPHDDLLKVDKIEVEEEESKDFFSSEYGPIISAAQSTTILYSATELTASFLMDNGSTEGSQINLHTNRFTNRILYILMTHTFHRRDIGQSINAVIDLLLHRGANPDMSACPFLAIMYPILASDVAGVLRIARKSSKNDKVIVA